LLLTGGHAGAGLPPASPIIPVIAVKCRHAHVALGSVTLARRVVRLEAI
jgi:hypothetical protein